MNKLVISPEAARDLEKIKQYIIYELKNPSAARRVVRGITKDLRILEHYAEAGPSVAALTGYSSDLRILVDRQHGQSDDADDDYQYRDNDRENRSIYKKTNFHIQ